MPDVRTLGSGADWIETERLLLRRYEASHFSQVVALTAHVETFRFSERGPMSSEEAWGRLLRHIGQWTVSGYGFFAVVEKDTGRFVGEAGFGDFRRQLGPMFEGTPEMGWTIAPEAHCRGFATEAAGAALNWMYERFGTPRTVCVVHADNAPSLRVAEKLGFRPKRECTYKGYRAVLHERVLA